MSQRTCAVCGEVFEHSRPGRPPKSCPEHRDAYYKAWFAAHYVQNADRKKQQVREWVRANPDRKKAADKAYHAAHPVSPEQRRANWRRYYAKNREKNIQRVIAYGRAHPEWMAERNRRRKALRRGAPSAERITLAKLFARDRGRCHICRKRVKRSAASVDHIIPVSLGGPHSWANVALAHGGCNSSKGNRPANDQLRLV